MTNRDLVFFAQTWKSLDSDAREMIERIVDANELHDALLDDLDVPTLQRALEELRCCNVPQLVRLVDDVCEEAGCYQQ